MDNNPINRIYISLLTFCVVAFVAYASTFAGDEVRGFLERMHPSDGESSGSPIVEIEAHGQIGDSHFAEVEFQEGNPRMIRTSEWEWSQLEGSWALVVFDVFSDNRMSRFDNKRDNPYPLLGEEVRDRGGKLVVVRMDPAVHLIVPGMLYPDICGRNCVDHYVYAPTHPGDGLYVSAQLDWIREQFYARWEEEAVGVLHDHNIKFPIPIVLSEDGSAYSLTHRQVGEISARTTSEVLGLIDRFLDEKE